MTAAAPRLRLAVTATAVAVALATLFAGNPMAYVLSGPTWLQAQMSYVVNPANLDLAATTAANAVRAGADRWQAESGAFQFVYAGTSAQTTTTNDGINLVLFRAASNGSAIATTYWWSNGTRIVDADIVFWDSAFTFYAGSAGCSGGFYIEDIAVHEFGHALGLGHSASTSATMYPSTSACNTQNRTLDTDDIAGVRALYPVTAAGPAVPRNLRIVSTGR